MAQPCGRMPAIWLMNFFFLSVNEIWRWEGRIGREMGQEAGAALEVSVGRRGAAGGRAAC